MKGTKEVCEPFSLLTNLGYTLCITITSFWRLCFYFQKVNLVKPHFPLLASHVSIRLLAPWRSTPSATQAEQQYVLATVFTNRYNSNNNIRKQYLKNDVTIILTLTRNDMLSIISSWKKVTVIWFPVQKIDVAIQI